MRLNRAPSEDPFRFLLASYSLLREEREEAMAISNTSGYLFRIKKGMEVPSLPKQNDFIYVGSTAVENTSPPPGSGTLPHIDDSVLLFFDFIFIRSSTSFCLSLLFSCLFFDIQIEEERASEKRGSQHFQRIKARRTTSMRAPTTSVRLASSPPSSTSREQQHKESYYQMDNNNDLKNKILFSRARAPQLVYPMCTSINSGRMTYLPSLSDWHSPPLYLYIYRSLSLLLCVLTLDCRQKQHKKKKKMYQHTQDVTPAPVTKSRNPASLYICMYVVLLFSTYLTNTHTAEVFLRESNALHSEKTKFQKREKKKHKLNT
eukprot:gene9769-6852_t